MTWGHVPDHELMDVAMDAGAARARRHVAGCARCQLQVDEVRAGLALAAAAEVPEPSPLYWEAARRRMAGAAAAPPAAPHRRLRPVLGAALVSAAAVAAVMFVPSRPPVPDLSPAPVLPAWSALPDGGRGLELIEALEPQVAEVVSQPATCRDLADCVASLTDEEGGDLARALRQELTGAGAL